MALLSLKEFISQKKRHLLSELEVARRYRQYILTHKSRGTPIPREISSLRFLQPDVVNRELRGKKKRARSEATRKPASPKKQGSTGKTKVWRPKGAAKPAPKPAAGKSMCPHCKRPFNK